MLFQKLQIFFLKTSVLVVRSLLLDVRRHGFQIRFADGKRAIAFLPGKLLKRRKFAVNPFRRIAFEILRNLADSHRRRSHHQRVDVVVTAADLQRRHFVLPRYAAEVGPDSLLNFWLEVGDTIFGAEDKVILQQDTEIPAFLRAHHLFSRPENIN